MNPTDERQWLYRLGPGGDNPVRHAIRRDVHPMLAECGSRGPFMPRVAGEPKDCPTCLRYVQEFKPVLASTQGAGIQSAGGLARAAKLSPKRRSEIAKKAAMRRWARR